MWCSGSCSRLVIRRLRVRIPLGAYAPRTRHFVHNCLSRPRCSKWVPSRNLFLRMLLALKGCMRVTAGVIMPQTHRDAIWMWYVLYKNGTLSLYFLLFHDEVPLLDEKAESQIPAGVLIGHASDDQLRVLLPNLGAVQGPMEIPDKIQNITLVRDHSTGLFANRKFSPRLNLSWTIFGLVRTIASQDNSFFLFAHDDFSPGLTLSIEQEICIGFAHKFRYSWPME